MPTFRVPLDLFVTAKDPQAAKDVTRHAIIGALRAMPFSAHAQLIESGPPEDDTGPDER